MKKLLRAAAALLCLAAAAYFLMPLAFGVFHIGMVYPAAILLLSAAALLFPGAVRRLFAGRLHRRGGVRGDPPVRNRRGAQ